MSTIANESDDGKGGRQPRKWIAFWNRPDVERCRRILDLWASCKRAQKAGVDGCPTQDAIFERPRPTVEPYLDPRTGLWVQDEEIAVRTSSMQPLPEPKIAEIDFDLFVEGHEIPKLAVGLLYHLYPRSGPYEQDGQLETFRPKFLSGRLGASTTARKWKSFLNALHRETIAYLATHTAPIKHKNETKRIDN